MGVLFTFPSRYYFAIGHPGVFSLARWSLLIHKGFHVPHAARVIAVDHSARPAEENIPFSLPKNIEALKKQVVSLLKEAGGSLPLLKLPDYEKLSYLAEYKADMLEKILGSITDVVTIVEEGEIKALVLRREVEAGGSSSCDAPQGDLESLKKEIVGLLKGSGGKLPLVELSSEYTKMYRRALSSVENGDDKLVKLLESIGDAVTIVEEENDDVAILQREEEDGSSSFDKRKRRKIVCMT